MCKTLCHGIGRAAAAACATWPAPCKVTKNYDTRMAAAGRSGSKRCRGVSKLTKIVTIRQKISGPGSRLAGGNSRLAA